MIVVYTIMGNTQGDKNKIRINQPGKRIEERNGSGMSIIISMKLLLVLVGSQNQIKLLPLSVTSNQIM